VWSPPQATHRVGRYASRGIRESLEWGTSRAAARVFTDR